MTFNELRSKYDKFIYNGFTVRVANSTLHIAYDFEMGEHRFAPTWEIPLGESAISADDAVINRLAFALGMTELISYYKCACPKIIEVRCASMDAKQIAWFEDLIFEGLSEFRYINGIILGKDEFAKIIATGAPLENECAAKPLCGTLIPIGGGKDSAVTLELLSRFKDENAAYIINPRGASRSCAVAAGYENKTVAPKRTLDKHIIELNAAGYLNGHTPFSAMLAFSAVLSAYIHGKKYVALSNESSANESTVEGTSINHQYSKTYRFEKAFREYIENYAPCGVEYFSLLRPYSEFQIARAFARDEKYFDIFKSCNVGSKTDSWCGKCPKCLFVYIMLSPFIAQERLAQIFGANLLDDESLIHTMDKLIGAAPEKPFECVGSRAEARAALCLACEKAGEDLALLKSFKVRGFYDKYKGEMHSFEQYFDGEHFVPEKFIYTFDLMR